MLCCVLFLNSLTMGGCFSKITSLSIFQRNTGNGSSCSSTSGTAPADNKVLEDGAAGVKTEVSNIIMSICLIQRKVNTKNSFELLIIRK